MVIPGVERAKTGTSCQQATPLVCSEVCRWNGGRELAMVFDDIKKEQVKEVSKSKFGTSLI